MNLFETMGKSEKITHEGIAFRVESGKVFVKIESLSACANCHARGACSSLDKSSKIIEAYADEPISVGESVIVEMSESLGLLAVFYVFVIPMIIFLIFMGVIYSFTGNDFLSVISASSTFVVYFFILYRMKHRLTKSFIFRARKI